MDHRTPAADRIDWQRLNLDVHLNDSTQDLARVLIDAFGDEHGREVLSVIVRELGGSRIDVHNGDRLAREVAQAEARRMLEEGEAWQAVRDRTGLNYRAIHRLRQEVAEAT